MTTYLTRTRMTSYDCEQAVLPAQYIEAVTRAGGRVVLIPPQPLDSDQARDLVGALDGLVVTGGEDVNPSRYGQNRGPHTQDSVDVRDECEDALLGAAIDQGVPVLGICRGLQLLNVHRGGTLHQHLPDVIGHTRYSQAGGTFSPEDITITPGSRLADIFQGAPSVTGFVGHHQAIDEVGSGLAVTARGFDGVIQAIELEGHPFALGVQWHPEENLDDIRLVEALVAAASSGGIRG